MSNYNIEFKKYLKYCEQFNGPAPSFYQYLDNKRQTAQDKRNYKKVQYYDEIISEETDNNYNLGLELNNID